MVMQLLIRHFGNNVNITLNNKLSLRIWGHIGNNNLECQTSVTVFETIPMDKILVMAF